MHRRSSLRRVRRAFALLGLLLIVQTGWAAQFCLSLLGNTPAAVQAMGSASDAPMAPCCDHAPEPTDCLANPYGVEPGTPMEAPSTVLTPLMATVWVAHPSPPEAGSRPPLASPRPEVPVPIRLHRYLS